MSIAKSVLLIMLPVVLLSSCIAKKATTANTEVEQSVITVTGEVTTIENGKDGYVATVKNIKGKEYKATISIVNLQKSGGSYKSSKVGDIITVTGESWKDAEGNTYIKATNIK